jgi:hypothetical protein
MAVEIDDRHDGYLLLAADIVEPGLPPPLA